MEVITPLNILETLYHIIPHTEGRPHPRIQELESITYREEYDEMFSDSGFSLGCYGKDEYDERYVEILTKGEYEKLPEEPLELKQLREERKKCLSNEGKNGILHITICGIEKIEVPKLELRIPENNYY